jgi:AhpD family alkylhydroperoxidase
VTASRTWWRRSPDFCRGRARPQVLNTHLVAETAMDYFYVKKRSREVTKYFDQATLKAWGAYNDEAFKPGKLDVKTKELVAVACTYITRCPYCIESHAKKALKAGATRQELAEVIAIAAALNAGASMAHMNFALEAEPDK